MKKPLAPNPAIWGNLESTPAPPAEPAKPAKKYLSLEEVEAQLLASQRPAQPIIPAPPPQKAPILPQLPSGTQVPQHVGQQPFIEDKPPQFKPSQYQRGPQTQQQQFPHPRQGQFRPPQGTGPQQSPQRSPQRSPVRQTHGPPPPQRPVNYTGPPPPPNFQEIMAAENQRLLAEDAKRRKRNQKITEMVYSNLPFFTYTRHDTTA